jgi:hypothetical protein
VLKVLKQKGSIRFNENFFFDGRKEQVKQLHKAMGFVNEIEYFRVPVLADCAVELFQRDNLVRIDELPRVMLGGAHDYRITLTEKGKALVESGAEFAYSPVSFGTSPNWMLLAAVRADL